MRTGPDAPRRPRCRPPALARAKDRGSARPRTGSGRVAPRLRIWLEAGALEGGSGFWLRDAASGDALAWDDDRLIRAAARVVRVAGTSYREDALQSEAFAPGAELAIVPEPANEHDPNALGVWDSARSVQVGYVPAEIAAELEPPLQAVSLWEWQEDERRVGLRVLVAPPAVWIGRPRDSP